jgi:hypothetical protein
MKTICVFRLPELSPTRLRSLKAARAISLLACGTAARNCDIRRAESYEKAGTAWIRTGAASARFATRTQAEQKTVSRHSNHYRDDTYAAPGASLNGMCVSLTFDPLLSAWPGNPSPNEVGRRGLWAKATRGSSCRSHFPRMPGLHAAMEPWFRVARLHRRARGGTDSRPV